MQTTMTSTTMTTKKTLTHSLMLAMLGLGLTASALASDADNLLGARDAFQRKDDAQLAAYAAAMGNSPLLVYPRYWEALRAVTREDDHAVSQYLLGEIPSPLTEKVRNEWIKSLGKRELWGRFGQEWAQLPEAGRDDESSCYADLWLLNQGLVPAGMDRLHDSRTVPEGCNRLITTAAERKMVSPEWVLKRIRLLVAGNHVNAARDIAFRTKLPVDAALGASSMLEPTGLNAQEAMLFSLLERGRSNVETAAAQLMTEEEAIGPERAKFAWGQFALIAAKKQLAVQAMQWFGKADPKQLTSEQWEWWVRSALRNQQWPAVEMITRNMPSDLSAKPAWRYWRARSLKALGRGSEAGFLLNEASRSNGFYGVLAMEELGRALDLSPPAYKPSSVDLEHVESETIIQRVRRLLEVANQYQRPELREDALREWRWILRNRTDNYLLAAAELAKRDGAYDFAIYSAERTRLKHDYSLRYLSPYREVAQRYANQLGVDEAWVYGLIRQESRFVTVARSGVGASGLMQLMPGTARDVARKIGLSSYNINDIETNIQLGIWYLRSVNNRFGHPVLATAGYNAGPGRARTWQNDHPLEGAIYAETIPFLETREYVQKVMTNAVYYASGFGQGSVSLKARMGVVPAR
jgi:soluble lytic murein transglycosylase